MNKQSAKHNADVTNYKKASALINKHKKVIKDIDIRIKDASIKGDYSTDITDLIEDIGYFNLDTKILQGYYISKGFGVSYGHIKPTKYEFIIKWT